jgi:hypothetical protein
MKNLRDSSGLLHLAKLQVEGSHIIVNEKRANDDTPLGDKKNDVTDRAF